VQQCVRPGHFQEQRPAALAIGRQVSGYHSKDATVVDFYLVRHGDAVSELVDVERPLSEMGRVQVARLAQQAAAKGVQPAVIYHSGILRARQTAEIMSEQLRPARGMAPMDGLQPMADPAGTAAMLELATDSIMLVGHLPFMNRIVGLLVKGNAERIVVDFAPATLVCLAKQAPRWGVQWSLAP